MLSAALLFAVAATVAPAIADASTAPPSDASVDSSDNSFEPVTIEHRYGTTEITERPERIVSLDGQWTDTLVALGTAPVGYAIDWTLDGDFPWLGDELADSERIDANAGIPYEQVAALEPDLIVITWGATDEATYESLAAIAPTISSVSDAVVDPWKDITTVAGQVLGETEAADELIARTDEQIADLAAEFPGLAGKTFTFANYIAGDKFYVLTDPTDGAVEFFTALGLELPPAIAGAEAPPGGRFEVSFEQVGLLDADVLVLSTNGADPTEIVGYDQLSAVQNGSAVAVDYAAAVGLNVPSALSILYGIEAVRPALDAAA